MTTFEIITLTIGIVSLLGILVAFMTYRKDKQETEAKQKDKDLEKAKEEGIQQAWREQVTKDVRAAHDKLRTQTDQISDIRSELDQGRGNYQHLSGLLDRVAQDIDETKRFLMETVLASR
jgi:Flp pilus assembly protein TadB